MSAEDAEEIARLAREGSVWMHLVLTPKTLSDEPSNNVTADLPGSEHPEEVVTVWAHVDSWDLGTGAIDNGAGVAEILQAAQVLQQLGVKPRRTIRFIAYMNEENAANGGNGHTQYLKDHAAELARHRASIEIDVGTWHPAGYEAYASDSLLQALRPLRSVLGKMSSGVVRIRESSGEMDDYAPSLDPFCDCKDYYASHHTVADTFAMIDAKGLQENAALVGVLAFAMATVPDEVIQHPKPKPAER